MEHGLTEDKLDYARGFKKRLLTTVVTISFVISFIIMTGLKSNFQFTIGILLIILSCYSIFILIKKYSKEVLCPHCDANIYDDIQLCLSSGQHYSYCPKCRTKIEI